MLSPQRLSRCKPTLFRPWQKAILAATNIRAAEWRVSHVPDDLEDGRGGKPQESRPTGKECYNGLIPLLFEGARGDLGSNGKFFSFPGIHGFSS
jgi:hypothetical protein